MNGANVTWQRSVSQRPHQPRYTLDAEAHSKLPDETRSVLDAAIEGHGFNLRSVRSISVPPAGPGLVEHHLLGDPFDLSTARNDGDRYLIARTVCPLPVIVRAIVRCYGDAS